MDILEGQFEKVDNESSIQQDKQPDEKRPLKKNGHGGARPGAGRKKGGKNSVKLVPLTSGLPSNAAVNLYEQHFKRPHRRPRKYECPKQLVEDGMEFITECDRNGSFPVRDALLVHLGISHLTLKRMLGRDEMQEAIHFIATQALAPINAAISHGMNVQGLKVNAEQWERLIGIDVETQKKLMEVQLRPSEPEDRLAHLR